MLDRLGEVAWEGLTCATGSAADLPTVIKQLASSEREEAIAALDGVRSRLWRDGAIFEAAPAAAPFLIELAQDAAVLVRPPLLQLLAFLFGGDAPTMQTLAQADEATRASLEVQTRLTVERLWVDATRTAVRRGLGAYLALLADDDRDVRIAAACLVVAFHDPDAEVEVRRALTARVFNEPDEVVRANDVACLNVYLPRTHLEAYDLVLENDASLLVRREAAHSIAAIEREATPKLVVAVLLEAIMAAEQLGPLYAGVAWNRSGLVADTCWALTRLGGEAARPYLRYLEKLIVKAHPEDALAIAEAALLLAFGGPSATRPLSSLEPHQMSLLRALVEVSALWGRELMQMMAHYGLPRDQGAMRAFLFQA